MSNLIRTKFELDLKAKPRKKAKQQEEGAQAQPVEKRPIFLALQGGGARGIVHVGALTAINELDLDVKGVAGTSAGSIVAALIAAGYTGNDLLDADLSEPKHLFNRMPLGTKVKKPTDLFSGGGWGWLRLIRLLPTAQRLKLIHLSGASLICGYAYLSYLSIAYSVWLGLPLNLVVAISVGLLVKKISDGLTTLDRVRDFVNAALMNKLGWAPVSNGEPPRDVTFLDLRKAKKIPLKIIATNTSAESVEVFSVQTTPDVAVADAVAASICLPAIFKPWKVSFQRSGNKKPITHQFLDGGFVSNLPAWPFDEERLISPEIPTIALSIVTPNAESKHWSSSIINTIVNGTAEIDTRAVGRLAKIPLKTNWGMLDFDKDFHAVYLAALQAKQVTLAQLSTELVDAPKALRSAAQAILLDIVELMERVQGIVHQELSLTGKVRVAILAKRDRTPKLLSMVSTAGYQRDAGFGSVITTRHPGGVAWKERTVRISKVDPSERIFRANTLGAQWIVCVPLRPTKNVLGVLVKPCVIMIELDFPLLDHNSLLREQLKDLGACIGELVNAYNHGDGIANFVQGTNSCL
ncbi:patatin-like phospholipase family protein [Pseudomonas sp. 25 E 4]|uniref:patatin-like phospholipase family protein n=1 Tax=Pseudomonas sp. 25 E 4 TaxID=1844097 RepID=UPI000812BE6C|nr:patatin-like phospholipase family protein [Pseudomonas sp. 25 E 4]CRM69684.1 Patatin [Pseudomonas sp. 25 E 4]